MKRITLVLLAVVMMAGVGGCKDGTDNVATVADDVVTGGDTGGDASIFDFNGFWTMDFRTMDQTATPCGNFSKDHAMYSMDITQTGSAISFTVQMDDNVYPIGTGTVDGASFLATAPFLDESRVIQFQVSSTGANSATGNVKLICDGTLDDRILGTFTMNRS